jgi:hypothetical protein
MQLYYNIYYRFYKLSVSLGETGIARYNAVLIFSLVQIFNLFELIALVSIINGKIYIVNGPKLPLLIIGLGIILINTLIVFTKKRYEKIDGLFANESQGNHSAGMILTICYVALTFALFALCLVYLNNHPITNGHT